MELLELLSSILGDIIWFVSSGGINIKRKDL